MPDTPAEPALSQVLKDSNGEFSSKRAAAAFALINLAGLVWYGVITGHTPPDASLYLWGSIALGSLGLTLPEWFSPKQR